MAVPVRDFGRLWRIGLVGLYGRVIKLGFGDDDEEEELRMHLALSMAMVEMVVAAIEDPL